MAENPKAMTEFLVDPLEEGQRILALAESQRRVGATEGPPLSPALAEALERPLDQVPQAYLALKRDEAEVAYAIARSVFAEAHVDHSRLEEAAQRDLGSRELTQVAFYQGVADALTSRGERLPEGLAGALAEAKQDLSSLDRRALELGIEEAQVRMGLVAPKAYEPGV